MKYFSMSLLLLFYCVVGSSQVLVPNTYTNGNGKEKNRAINRRVVITLE